MNFFPCINSNNKLKKDMNNIIKWYFDNLKMANVLFVIEVIRSFQGLEFSSQRLFC